MDIRITPSRLEGSVTVPPSKSAAHRLIIAAALAKGRSVLTNVSFSKDIEATIGGMRALGAGIERSGGSLVIDGITQPPKTAVIDCIESGSTLRFLIPVACALGVETTFLGRGRLPERPITPYIEQFPGHGVEFDYSGTMPFTVRGKLTGGSFDIAGDISSQFITGLMLALPLTGDNSRIRLTSHLESRPYVELTADCLSRFGVNVKTLDEGFEVPGAEFSPYSGAVEGDFSQAAFFYVANSLGSRIEIEGLNVNSFQGDKKIVEICEKIVYNNNGGLKAFELDCSDIPDLVPVLAVLGCFCRGTSVIKNAARLRIKECDRLAAITQCLNSLGGRISERPDGLVIEGVESLKGGEVPSFNDHRIPMAVAVASTRARGEVVIKDAECVSKSYPDFFEVFRSLGGRAEEL